MIFSQCIWRICNDKQDLTWLTLSKGNISLVNSIELFQQVNITNFALMDFAQPPSKASYDPKLYFQFIKPRVSFHNLWSSRGHHALLIVLVHQVNFILKEMAFTEGDIVDYAECIEVTFFALSLLNLVLFLITTIRFGRQSHWSSATPFWSHSCRFIWSLLCLCLLIVFGLCGVFIDSDFYSVCTSASGGVRCQRCNLLQAQG